MVNNRKTVSNNATQSFNDEDWTLLSAMNRVQCGIEESGMSPHFWAKQNTALNYLSRRLELTPQQILLIVAMIENGNSITWKCFARYAKCSVITAMSFVPQMKELIKKKWAYHRCSTPLEAEKYVLNSEVIDALTNDMKYEPEKFENITTRQFLTRFNEYYDQTGDGEETCMWALQVCEANPQLPFCQTVQNYKDDESMFLMLMLAYNYMTNGDTSDEGVFIDDLDPYARSHYEFLGALKNEELRAQQDGWIEFKCENGISNQEEMVVTSKFRQELLYDVTTSLNKSGRNIPGLIKATSITSKEMFYNEDEMKQIDRLTDLLGEKKFDEVQFRLKQKGMRQGFACLFHGGPGTGKTETALQLARRTGRDIILVDIASMRDKYVGESEKNIKGIFLRYRQACKTCDRTPILFFNEADALINKRSTNTEGATDKMENAMQNIILQEMENFDGILIATTNLISNLDKAFDRRFIFKIHFNQPSIEVKAKLWRAMLDNEISQQEAETLASRYNFSGGQIDNIARQHTIDTVINGTAPSFETINEYCQQESLRKDTSSPRPIIGF